MQACITSSQLSTLCFIAIDSCEAERLVGSETFRITLPAKPTDKQPGNESAAVTPILRLINLLRPIIYLTPIRVKLLAANTACQP